MDEKLMAAAIPLLLIQRRTDKLVSLEECVQQARKHGVRADLVILLVRWELPFARPDCKGFFGPYVVDVHTSHRGGIRYNDREALEALQLVAEALGEDLMVRVVEGEGNPPV